MRLAQMGFQKNSTIQVRKSKRGIQAEESAHLQRIVAPTLEFVQATSSREAVHGHARRHDFRKVHNFPLLMLGIEFF